MHRTVEFKINEIGIAWESIHVSLMIRDRTSPPVDLVSIANALAMRLSRAYDAEVRWNYQGSDQGHYIRATIFII